MDTEVTVALLSILTLLENLIFLIISMKKDEKKELVQKKNINGLKLCEECQNYHELEDLYIDEISRLKSTYNESSSAKQTIKISIRNSLYEKKGTKEKLMQPAEVEDLKKLFSN